MIKKLLLVALFLIAGVAVGLYIQGVSITGLLGNAVSFAKSQLQPATRFIQHNAPFIGVAFTAVTTAGALIIRKLTKAKDAMAAQAEGWKNQALSQNTENLDILKQKEEVEQELSTFQEQTKLKIDGLEAQLTAKNDLIEKQRKEILRIEAEANALAHVDQNAVADLVVQKLKDASRVP